MGNIYVTAAKETPGNRALDFVSPARFARLNARRF
jgi:hypothetical protein